MSDILTHLTRVGLTPPAYHETLVRQAALDPAAAAQAVVEAAKAEGLDKPALLERLHLFYGRNRGAALDAEWVELLTRHLEGSR